MLKKTITLLIAVFLMFILAACDDAKGADTGTQDTAPVSSPNTDAPETKPPETDGASYNSNDAYGLYNLFLQKMGFYGDSDIEYDIDITEEREISVADFNPETYISHGNVKSKVIDSKWHYLIDAGNGFYFYSDGVNTIQVDSDGTENPMSVDLIETYIAFPAFGEDAVISVEIEKIGDNTKFTFLINGSKLDKSASRLPIVFDSNAFFAEDITLHYTIDKDGSPLEISTFYYVFWTESGGILSSDITIETTYTINAFGSGVEITKPQ